MIVLVLTLLLRLLLLLVLLVVGIDGYWKIPSYDAVGLVLTQVEVS